MMKKTGKGKITHKIDVEAEKDDKGMTKEGGKKEIVEKEIPQEKKDEEPKPYTI